MNTIDLETFQFEDSVAIRAIEQIQKIAGLKGYVLIEGPVSSGKTQHAIYLHSLENSKSQIHFFDASLGESPLEFVQSRNQTDTYVLENVEALNSSTQEKLVHLLNATTPKYQRLIFTMNLNAENKVDKKIRNDLFFKISTFKVALSFLNERAKDFDKMATFYLDIMRILYGKPVRHFSAAALRKMKEWAWPGQIRELENVIERAFLVCGGDTIEAHDISFTTLPNSSVQNRFEGLKLSEVERHLIVQTLEMTEQNRTKAAEILGISSRTLRNKLNEYREAGVL